MKMRGVVTPAMMIDHCAACRQIVGCC